MFGNIRKVSALYFQYDYYGSIHLTHFIIITNVCFSVFGSISSTKIQIQDSRGTNFHTGC